MNKLPNRFRFPLMASVFWIASAGLFWGFMPINGAIGQDGPAPPPVRPVEGKPKANPKVNPNMGRLAEPFFGNQSFSQSVQNGVTTTKMKQGGKEIEVEETPDGIFMNVINLYTLDDLEELNKSNPELAKVLEAFPREVNGESIDVSVRTTKRYEAINDEELETDYPEAFKAYKAVKEMSNRPNGAGRGAFGRMGGMPLGGGLNGIDGPFEEMQQRMREEILQLQQKQQGMLRGFGGFPGGGVPDARKAFPKGGN